MEDECKSRNVEHFWDWPELPKLNVLWEKKYEGVTEYFEKIKLVKSVNLKRKIGANSA